jgi:hypothetical protein
MSDDTTPVVGYVLVRVGLVAAIADTLERIQGNLDIVSVYATRVQALVSGTATAAERVEWHRQAVADAPNSRDQARELGVAVEGLRQRLIAAAAPVGRVS